MDIDKEGKNRRKIERWEEENIFDQQSKRTTENRINSERHGERVRGRMMTG